MSSSIHSSKRARMDDGSANDGRSSLDTRSALCGGEIIDDVRWTDGDFEIITSDNVRFLVPSYHLFSSSAVFRDAHHIDNSADSRTLALTDSTCETAPVLHLYLQLVSHGTLAIHRHLPHWKELVVFLDKWDCRQPLQLLCSTLGMAIQNKEVSVSTLEAFIVAALAGDDNLCHMILTIKRHSKWKTVKEGEGGREYQLSSSRRKESLWDPRFFPAYLWTSGVSNKYLYAVSRAFGDHGAEEGLADGFRHYLAQMNKRNPHDSIHSHIAATMGKEITASDSWLLPPKIVDDSEFAEGDFEIISSDATRFRVPSYHLMSSSAVFQDALALDNGAERSVTFSDDVCETAAVLRLYLQLVVHGTLPMEGYLPHMRELALFLGKWDCQRAMGHMLSLLENAVRRHAVQAHHAFIVAANADHPDVCALILSSVPDATWSAPKGVQADPLWSPPGESVWNPTWFNQVMYACLPKRYLFALARAYGKGDCSKLASKFERYIKLIPDM